MQEKTNDFNSFGLIRFVWEKRKILTIITLTAAVLSFVATLLIRPQFKSTAIIFAPRTNALSRALVNTANYNERLDIKAYAVEEETEQMMQILHSRELKDVIIQKFNLLEHYGLTKDEKYWQTKLYDAVEGRVIIKRTEFGAISITVWDWDNVLASEIANEIVFQLDIVKNKIENERASAAYYALEQQLIEANAMMAMVNDSLKVLAQNGVFMLEPQVGRIMQQYALAVSQGNNVAIQRLQKELEKMSLYGPATYELQNQQYFFAQYQSLCRERLLNAKMDMSGKIPMKFVVERAIPSDKKSYPKRLIITLISSLAAFTLALITLLIIENIKTAPSTIRQPEASKLNE